MERIDRLLYKLEEFFGDNVIALPSLDSARETQSKIGDMV